MPHFDARIAYLYADLPSYARVKKTLPVLRDLAREVHYIGSPREKGWGNDAPSGVHYHLHDRVIPNGLGGLVEVARFTRFVRRTLDEIRPDVLIVVNEEQLLPLAVGYGEKPPVLVLEMYDSISMRIARGGRHLRPMWKTLSTVAMLSADALIEVHESRLPFYPYKPNVVTVLHNAPPAVDSPHPPRDLPVEKYIYLGGTVEDELMGIKPLYAALEKVPDVQILVAGKTNGRFVEERFLKHKQVHYIGVRPYEDVPGLVAGSLGVYAHYSPTRLNYVYGAPNKLYEAYQAAVPVLLNTENNVHLQAKRLGCGRFSPYGDVNALARDLHVLWHEPDRFQQGCAAARELFDREYAWDRVAPEKYQALFEQLGVKKEYVSSPES